MIISSRFCRISTVKSGFAKMSVTALGGLIAQIAPFGIQALQIDANSDLAAAQAELNAQAAANQAALAAQTQSSNQFNLILLSGVGLLGLLIFSRRR